MYPITDNFLLTDSIAEDVIIWIKYYPILESHFNYAKEIYNRAQETWTENNLTYLIELEKSLAIVGLRIYLVKIIN